jgi:beta-glucosidase
MKEMGTKAFRFSIEWSRIEPEEGKHDMDAVRHYHAVIDELLKNGIIPWVTIWHRTSPLWIAAQGGWPNRKTISDYLLHVEFMVQEFGDTVHTWMPLNESVLHVAGGYLGGNYPPARKNLFAGYAAFRNLVQAQKKAYALIHSLQKDAFVGACHAAICVEPYQDRWYNRFIVGATNYVANWKYLNAIRHHIDFIGIQYYTRTILNVNLKPNLRNDKATFIQEVETSAYPEGLYSFIMQRWKRYHLPIVVTENGLIDPHDEYRSEYIEKHLMQLLRAMGDGVDVRGYLHWSLLDSFEWNEGFWPRFGLVEVDYKTYARTIRPSFRRFAEIIRNNRLT